MSTTAKKLGFWSLFAIALGNVVGSGIVTLVGQAMEVTGLSAWLSYGVTVILGFFTILPFIFIGSAVILRGGEYTVILSMLGELPGGIYSICGITYCITVAMMGRASAQYICELIPGLNSQLVAIVVITIFYIFNMLGVDVMAKVQKFMVWFLLAALLIFSLLGLTHIGNPDVFNFQSPNFFLGGAAGFTASIAIFAYSVHAQYMVINFGADAKNPRKDIPRVIILVSVIVLVLYVLVGITACGVLPFDQAAGATLLPTSVALLGKVGGTVFVILGPLFAIFTTLNSYYSARALPMLRAAKDGWFPDFISKTNRFGSPTIILTFFWLISVVLLLGGAGIVSLANNLSLVSTLLRLISAFAVIRLPKVFPEAWAKAGLHVPMWLFYLLMGISFCSLGYIVYLSFVSLELPVAIANLSVFVIAGLYASYRYKTGKVHIVTAGSIEEISD